MSEYKIACKGNAFLKALADSDKYGIKDSTAMLELIKQHVSQTLAEDMLYELLSQTFEDDTPYVTLKDCGPRFINCIKLVRHFTKLGLKDAKDLCDKVKDRSSIPQRVSFSNLYSRADVINAFRREGCIVE